MRFPHKCDFSHVAIFRIKMRTVFDVIRGPCFRNAAVHRFQI